MQSRETQITMVKWTNAGGQTKGANERSFVYRPPVWRRWRNVRTTYMLALFNLFRNVMNHSNLWKIDWKGKITLKLVQARGTHTPTQICAQPYHARSSSQGQLFGIYWGSSVWTVKTRVSKTLYYRGECKAKSAKCQLHATHVGRRIMGWCMCDPCFKFVFWK